MSSYQNYCMSPFRWNIEKNNRFYMLQDNKCVLNCLYFYIRTYTDVFYMYCISFRFNVYVYISIPIYVLSWLWILVLIAVFFVSNLMYCFFMLCQKWRNKQVIYIKSTGSVPVGINICKNKTFYDASYCTQVLKHLLIIHWRYLRDTLSIFLSMKCVSIKLLMVNECRIKGVYKGFIKRFPGVF